MNKKNCGSFLYANFIVPGDGEIIDHSMIDLLQCRIVLILNSAIGKLEVEGLGGEGRSDDYVGTMVLEDCIGEVL